MKMLTQQEAETGLVLALWLRRYLDKPVRSFTVYQLDRETGHCENLVGTKRRIVHAKFVVAVDHVEQTIGRFVPKSICKTRFALLEKRFPFG